MNCVSCLKNIFSTTWIKQLTKREKKRKEKRRKKQKINYSIEA
jgi:hypothetical protein